jgi:hypothetical protein
MPPTAVARFSSVRAGSRGSMDFAGPPDIVDRNRVEETVSARKEVENCERNPSLFRRCTPTIRFFLDITIRAPISVFFPRTWFRTAAVLRPGSQSPVPQVHIPCPLPKVPTKEQSLWSVESALSLRGLRWKLSSVSMKVGPGKL